MTVGLVVANPFPFKAVPVQQDNFVTRALQELQTLSASDPALLPISSAQTAGSVSIIDVSAAATRLDQANALGNLGLHFLKSQGGADLDPQPTTVAFKMGAASALPVGTINDPRHVFIINYEGDPPAANGSWGMISTGPGPLSGPGMALDLSRFDLMSGGRSMEFDGPAPSVRANDMVMGPLMPLFTNGSSTGLASIFSSSNASIQNGSLLETASPGWMSYVTTGGWGTSLLQSSTFHSGDDPATEEGSPSTLPPQVAPAPDGFLSDLLTGPDAVTLTAVDNIQQFAELVPLPGSSLALIATLWTVSSDSQTALARWNGASVSSLVPSKPAVAQPNWTGFVMGLDEALEQSGSDVRAGILSDDWLPNEDRGSDAFGEPLEEYWPIVLLPAGEASEIVRGLARTSRGKNLDEEIPAAGGETTLAVPAGLSIWTNPAEETAPGSEEGRLVASGTISVLSVSASALIASRVWRKRKRQWRSYFSAMARKGQ
jgi:hypothetical protein